MDLKVVSELIKLVSESKLTSLEVEEKDFRIKLEKNNSKSNGDGNVNNAKVTAAKETASFNVEKNEIVIPEASAVVEEEKVESKIVEGAKIVKSPIVGTFYISSSPESEAFVTKGKRVKKGDTLCIIEAMKLMNEIDSEFDCEVLDVLVENGAIVEYGQPLFSVK
jgi:acetyl-CoA carboxylase biotin carboxyl carrier protein